MNFFLNWVTLPQVCELGHNGRKTQPVRESHRRVGSLSFECLSQVLTWPGGCLLCRLSHALLDDVTYGAVNSIEQFIGF